MKFGPLDSPTKTVDLLNLVDHLRVVLAAIPFVSQVGLFFSSFIKIDLDADEHYMAFFLMIITQWITMPANFRGS